MSNGYFADQLALVPGTSTSLHIMKVRVSKSEVLYLIPVHELESQQDSQETSG